MITQKQKVIDRINEVGFVDNFWAFHNYVLRLGAIIFELKKDGWEFEGTFGKDKEKKNFFYVPKKRGFSKDVVCVHGVWVNSPCVACKEAIENAVVSGPVLVESVQSKLI